MTRYTNAASVDVLDEAERLMRQLRWIDFVAENEKVVYGDYSGWQPGEPLMAKLTSGIFVNEGRNFDPVADSRYTTNCRRPMMEEFDEDEDNDAYIRCMDCEVWWIGEDPCFSCGEKRLHIWESDFAMLLPIRLVTQFDPAYPGSRPEPPKRRGMISGALTMLQLEDLWLDGRRDEYEFESERYGKMTELSVSINFRDEFSEAMTRNWERHLLEWSTSLRSMQVSFDNVGYSAQSMRQSLRGMAAQFARLDEIDLPRPEFEYVPSYIDADAALTTSLYEAMMGFPYRYQPRDEWERSVVENRALPDDHVWTFTTDDNGQRVAIHMPQEIPTQRTFDVPRVGGEVLNEVRNRHTPNYFITPATERRRRDNG